VERILFRFSKGEPVRFVGHLDLMRVIERAMRRAGFPVAYSQGFNPRPRMSLASALTLGATSEWELCQLDLAEDLDPARLEAAVAALRAQLPAGVEIQDVWAIPLEKKNPYIQVTAADYELTLVGSGAAEAIRDFVTRGPGLPQARECAVDEHADPVRVKIQLPVGEQGAARIRDVVAELERALPGIRVDRLHRIRLYCELEPADGIVEQVDGKFGAAA
jgi:hypothetical protein